MSLTLSDAIHLLGNLLGEVLAARESPALLEAEERIRALAKARRAGDPPGAAQLAQDVASLPPATARAIASAFTLYFDLVNLAEEVHRIQELRRRAREQAPEPISESIGETVAVAPAAAASPATRWRRCCGTSASSSCSRRTRPRQSVGACSRSSSGSAATLSDLHRDDLVPQERAAAEVALRAEITALWLTDRARTARPEVTDEVRTGLYFVEHTFWEVLPRIHAELATALAEHYPGLTVPRRWLALGSWIGGDRDGNPYVTAAVTAETLRLAPGPRRRAAPPGAPGSRAAIHPERPAASTPRRARGMARGAAPPSRARRVPGAPLRRRALPHRAVAPGRRSGAASAEDMTARLLETRPHRAHARVDALADTLDLIAAAVPAPLAEDRLRTVRTQIDLFGLHAARLDLREHAGRLAGTLDQLRHAWGMERRRPGCPVTERARALGALLAAAPPDPPRPPTRTGSTTWHARPGRCSGCSPGPGRCTGPSSSGRS